VDSNQFDEITIAVAEGETRRTVLRRVFGGGLAAALAAIGITAFEAEDAEAKSCKNKCKKKKNKKARKNCKKKCNKDPKPDCTVDGDCDACETCDGGTCKSTCGDCETCDGGTCKSTCGGCEICDGGTCKSTCTGNQVCASGDCVCPDTGTCVVTPAHLGGWQIKGDESVEFDEGPGTPPLGTGSLELITPGGKKATFTYPALAGLAIEDITTLKYSTYMKNGGGTQVVVPAIKLPVNYDLQNAGGPKFTTLIFEPAYWEWGAANPVRPVLDTWQDWDAVDPEKAYWWTSRDIPGVPGGGAAYVTWAEIKAAIPDAAINPDGLLIETGSGTPSADGNADKLQVNDQTFDFEPDAAGRSRRSNAKGRRGRRR
jgi:hypothetical protein